MTFINDNDAVGYVEVEVLDNVRVKDVIVGHEYYVCFTDPTFLIVVGTDSMFKLLSNLDQFFDVQRFPAYFL